MQDDQYELLISNLYSAGAGRMPWAQAFGPLMSGLDLWGIQLLGVDKKAGTLLFSYDTGANPAAFLDYLRSYHQLNPRIAPSLSMSVNEWMHDHEHFDDEYVASSPFYQEFVIPHGSRYLSGTKVIEDEHTLVLFGAMRGLGKLPLSKEDVSTLNRVKRHLTEAMRNYLHLRVAHSELSAGHQLLSQFRYPMLLVDEQRGIRFQNDAATAALTATDHVLNRQGAFGCRDPESDWQLTLAIRTLDLSNLDENKPKVQRQYVRLLRPHGMPAALFVTALRPTASMNAFGHLPLALVVLHDPMQQQTLDPFIVAETFNLTPAEARVAVKLVGGMTPEAIADMTGVAVSTIRSQLKAVYSKTGLSRQSELIRLLTNFSKFDPMQPAQPAG